MAQQTLKPAEEMKKSQSASSIMSDNDGVSVDAIPLSQNHDHTIKRFKEMKARKIMIAMDNSEFSQKAINWVHTNLLRYDDGLLLISIWEEAVVNKLNQELDSELIHPNPDQSHSQLNKLSNTFKQAECFKNHKKTEAMLVEEGKITAKSIGEELCKYVDECGIDILVCGTRGLGGIKKAFLGSVSTFVSSNAKCTTIIVK